MSSPTWSPASHPPGEQRVDRTRRWRPQRCVNGRRVPDLGPPGLDGDHGLRVTRPAIRANLRGHRSTRDTSRCRRRIVVPPRQQVVAADVGLVADRDEARQPDPACRVCSSRAMPSPPDWVSTPTRPGSGRCGAYVAARLTPGAVDMMPRQLGPTTRTPAARAAFSSFASSLAPAGPTSEKPGESTTIALTSAAGQSRATSRTSSAGTTTTSRSTGPGTSASRGYARNPRMVLGRTPALALAIG